MLMRRRCACFDAYGKHIQSKAETFTVEGYHSLFRHFLAGLRRKTKCYSKSKKMLRHSIMLLMAKRNGELLIIPNYNVRIFRDSSPHTQKSSESCLKSVGGTGDLRFPLDFTNHGCPRNRNPVNGLTLNENALIFSYMFVEFEKNFLFFIDWPL